MTGYSGNSKGWQQDGAPIANSRSWQSVQSGIPISNSRSWQSETPIVNSSSWQSNGPSSTFSDIGSKKYSTVTIQEQSNGGPSSTFGDMSSIKYPSMTRQEQSSGPSSVFSNMSSKRNPIVTRQEIEEGFLSQNKQVKLQQDELSTKIDQVKLQQDEISSKLDQVKLQQEENSSRNDNVKLQQEIDETNISKNYPKPEIIQVKKKPIIKLPIKLRKQDKKKLNKEEPHELIGECFAPSGRLGISIYTVNGISVVHKIYPGSPLDGMLCEKDRIVGVDEIDTSTMDSADVTQLMSDRMNNTRKITYVRGGSFLTSNKGRFLD